MSDDRREQDRRERRERRRAQHQRREQQRPQKPRGRRRETVPLAADNSHKPFGPVEFPGIMGWMQRNARWMFLGGILVLVLSTGAGIMALNAPAADPAPEPTVTATATEVVDPNATATAEPEATSEAIQRFYSAVPPMTIDVEREYDAVFHTAKGTFTVALDPQAAPGYVNNFVFLAQNRFFDGLTFHRVIPGFVAQGGDPEGTSFGGPGYFLPEEKNDLAMETGVIAMARSSQGVSGSQFFITLAPQPALAADFDAFGRVTEGMNVVQALAARDPSQPNQPRGDVIERVEIIER